MVYINIMVFACTIVIQYKAFHHLTFIMDIAILIQVYNIHIIIKEYIGICACQNSILGCVEYLNFPQTFYPKQAQRLDCCEHQFVINEDCLYEPNC